MLAAPTQPVLRRATSCPIFERLSRPAMGQRRLRRRLRLGGRRRSHHARLRSRGSASPAPPTQELRQHRRQPVPRLRRDAWSPVPWPWLYGDAMNIPPPQTPRQNSRRSTQHAAGDAVAMGGRAISIADYDPRRPPPRHRRGAARRAGRHADPRRARILPRRRVPSRLRDDLAGAPPRRCTWRRSASSTCRPAGSRAATTATTLTPDGMTIPNGPLCGQMAGGITRWMAVPWQTDTASCRSGYDAAATIRTCRRSGRRACRTRC